MTERASSPELSTDSYTGILASYLVERGESELYKASLLGQSFVEQGLGPDDIIAVHAEALEEATRGLSYRRAASAGVDALQFLLDVMIAYGVHHRAYLDLRLRQQSHEAAVQLAQERQRAEDAARGDQEKSAILATISHELRTPLTTLNGSVQLAQRLLTGGNTDRVATLLSGAVAAVDRLSRLTEDLVAASRGAAQALTLTRLDLAESIQRACHQAEVIASGKGISLTIRPTAAQILIEADRHALDIILSNLLTNAIRYTDPGGAVYVDSGSADTTAWLAVTDTGIGMSPEQIERVFERFYRTPEAVNIESGGMGLGLAITQQLVAAHHGTIEVTSAPGQGSTFRVRLPLTPPVSASQEGAHG